MFTFILGTLVGIAIGTFMPNAVRRMTRRLIKGGIIFFEKARQASATAREDFEDIKAEAYAELEANQNETRLIGSKEPERPDEAPVKN